MTGTHAYAKGLIVWFFLYRVAVVVYVIVWPWYSTSLPYGSLKAECSQPRTVLLRAVSQEVSKSGKNKALHGLLLLHTSQTNDTQGGKYLKAFVTFMQYILVLLAHLRQMQWARAVSCVQLTKRACNNEKAWGHFGLWIFHVVGTSYLFDHVCCDLDSTILSQPPCMFLPLWRWKQSSQSSHKEQSSTEGEQEWEGTRGHF